MGEFGKFEIVIFLVLGLVASTHAGLEMGYYNETCPDAELIVRKYVKDHIPNGRPSSPAGVLRLFFHDCFVEGCDASVLLNYTSASGNKTERTSVINRTLKDLDFIDDVKKQLEDKCPGVVSCADTLALVARDAVYLTGGPHWDVPTGRKDGNVSNAAQPLKDLPFPADKITTLRRKFENKGLNLNDLVLLSGGHTIGISHCTSFTNRLYNFTGKGDQDPALDSKYANELKRKCTTINSTGSVRMDDGNKTMLFDLSYYKNVLHSMGLFGSDAALLTNSTTRSTVIELANGSPNDFFERFANAMVKMGSIGVKTGPEGNVRTNCAFVNN